MTDAEELELLELENENAKAKATPVTPPSNPSLVEALRVNPLQRSPNPFKAALGTTMATAAEGVPGNLKEAFIGSPQTQRAFTKPAAAIGRAVAAPLNKVADTIAETGGKAGFPRLAAAGGLIPAVAASAIPQTEGEVALQSSLGPLGEEIGAAGQGIKGFLKSRIPSVYNKLFTVPVPATERVLERGASKILGSGLEQPGMAESLLSRAQGLLASAREAAGKAVGRAEDAIASSGAGQILFDTKPIVQRLRSEMARLGMSGPTEALANKADVAQLNTIAKQLDSGLVSGSDLIKIKKLLDDKVKFLSGPLKQIGSQTERLIKNVSGEIRGTLHNAYPELSTAYKEFAEAAKWHDRFFKVLGGTTSEKAPIDAAEQTVKRLRSKFLSGQSMKNIIVNFDKHIANGQEVLNKLFDSIAAGEFSREAYRAPSSIALRSLAASGLGQPSTGGFLLRAFEDLGRSAAGVSAKEADVAGRSTIAALARARERRGLSRTP